MSKPSGIKIFGTDGEVIEDNQVIVVWDRIAKVFRFVANDGLAYLVDAKAFPDVKHGLILDVDKSKLTPYFGA